jgi:hypothetical protein
MIIPNVISILILAALIWLNISPKLIFVISLVLLTASFLFLVSGNNGTAELVAEIFFLTNAINILYDLFRPVIFKRKGKLP